MTDHSSAPVHSREDRDLLCGVEVRVVRRVRFVMLTLLAAVVAVLGVGLSSTDPPLLAAGDVVVVSAAVHDCGRGAVVSE